MANAEIVIAGPGELPLIADLYNEIFRPSHDVEFFRRRCGGGTTRCSGGEHR